MYQSDVSTTQIDKNAAISSKHEACINLSTPQPQIKSEPEKR